MRKIVLCSFVMLLSLGILNAQAILYDFENLSIGNLDGQDGWETKQHPFDNSGDMHVVGLSGINANSQTLFYGISGANYGADASHALPVGTFSDQMDSYEISFDFAPAVWGTQVGIGYDANMDGKITSSDLNEMSIIYNSTSTYVNVTLPSGQTAQILTGYTGNWVHITMTITDLASGGKLKVVEHDLVTDITRIIASNVSINATASTNNSNPDNWNMIYTHIEGAIGQIDNIKIEKNTAFCVVDILGDNSLCEYMPVDIDATAIAYRGSNYQTNNTVFAIPDGFLSGVVSTIEIGNSTALASDIYSITINSLTHEWVNDLILVLIAPNGSEITLASYVGMGGDNFIGTTFIMGALQNITTGTAPFTGEFNPSQSFSTLTGSAQGIWTLKVIDEYTGAAGTLDSWSLNIPGENSITNYLWSTGESGSELSQISIIPTGSSSVYVTVTDLNGDVASAQFDYTVMQSPDVTVSGPASICVGDMAVLTSNVICYGNTGLGDLQYNNSSSAEIPDDNFSGLNSTIVIANSGANASELISVTINSIVHTNVSDLSIFLTAPNGSWITLAANIGGNGDNYTETEFTASASNFAQFGIAPFTGQFLPADNISSFTGSAQGTWTLKVVDNSTGETGTLHGWTLKFPNYNYVENYLWSTGENGEDAHGINPVLSENSTITLFAVDANGCEGSNDISVSVNPIPSVDIVGFSEICLGADFTLTAYATADQTLPIVVSATNDAPMAIPEPSLAGVLSPININESYFLASELVSVKINSLIHPFVGDLEISLIAPDGSTIILVQYAGTNGDNFINTEFTMSATNPISNGYAPFTSSYLPEQPFSNLTGSAQGTWYLKVVDNSPGDNGTLYSWTLNLPEENIITNFAWSTGESGSGLFAIYPLPTSFTTYTVTVTDSRGCIQSDQIDVTVNVSEDVVITQNWGTLTSSATTGNQWYEQSLGMLDGETNQSYTPLVDGTYFCAVTDENDCYEVSNSINFIYSDLSNFNQDENVSVYPNPNNGLFSLEIYSESAQNMNLNLRNVQGQIVYSEQIDVKMGFRKDFDFTDLAPGIYSIQISNDTFSKVTKIVIQ